MTHTGCSSLPTGWENTSVLTVCLNSRNSHIYCLREALVEYHPFRDGFQLMATAQMIEKNEVFQQVISAFKRVLAKQHGL
jgi:hypothetical protein